MGILRRATLLASCALLFFSTGVSCKERLVSTWADIAVDASGHVTDVSFPEKVMGTGLAERLDSVIRNWEFEPAKVNGVAVPARTSLSVRLALKERADKNYEVTVRDAFPSPRMVKVTSPRYPEQALRSREEADVEVRATVQPDGSVTDIDAGGDKRLAHFNKAAADAVSQWRFRPEEVDGRTVATRVRIPIAFTINRHQTNRADILIDDPASEPSHRLVAESSVKLKTDVANLAL